MGIKNTVRMNKMSGVAQREHRQKDASWWESRPTLCKCFSQAQSRDFALFYILTQVIYPCLSIYCKVIFPEICLQLRYVWTEILSLQPDVRYVTLHVTEIPRIFIHSSNFWLMAGGSSLSHLNYANHFWRPSPTNNILSTQHCHVLWACNCDSWHFCLSLFLSFIISFSLWMDLSVLQ